MNRRTTILVHIACWSIFFLSPLTFLSHGEGFTLGHYLAACVFPLMLVTMFYINYLWLTPHCYLQADRRYTYWMVNILLCIGLGVLVHLWFVYIHSDDPHQEFSFWRTAFFVLRNIFNLALAAAIATTIQLSMRWHQADDARLQAEAAHAEAELRNLRNQINPHFLLNTLNNIYALTAIDSERAQEAIQQLSKLLRHMLYDNQADEVRLSDEVTFLENYVNLMKIRLPQTVDVTLRSQISEPGVMVAPLVFISLVENAFKHGISPTEQSFVHISIEADKQRIACSIENTNHPKSSGDRSGHGIGLQQVQRRLDLAYPGRYTWQRGASPDGKTYTSNIEIKLS